MARWVQMARPQTARSKIIYEYGDLPDQYGTLENGTVTTPAIHVTTDELYFGAVVDSEGDGNPDISAGMGATGGDDNDGIDDEDGIVFMTPTMVRGSISMAMVISTILMNIIQARLPMVRPRSMCLSQPVQ